jgi:hypothetical protein
MEIKRVRRCNCSLNGCVGVTGRVSRFTDENKSQKHLATITAVVNFFYDFKVK